MPSRSHGGPHRNRLAQLFRSRVSSVLLDKIQGDAQENDAGDDEEVGDLPGKRRNRAGHEEDDDQRILEAGEELQQQRPFLPLAEQVGAESGKPCFGLGTRQARGPLTLLSEKKSVGTR